MANPDRSVYDPPFDDDLMFDTVDEQETTRGRPLMILLGIVVVLAFAGVIWVAYRQGVEHAARSEPPILAQDPGPARVAAPVSQDTPVPDNPSYDVIAGVPDAAAPTSEALAPAPEEPAALPSSSASVEPPPNTVSSEPLPAPSPAESAPDMTVGEIPVPAPTRTAATPKAPAQIPTEIAAEPPPASPSIVDPLAPGTSLPPAPEFLPPAAEIAPPAPAKPTAAELATAKAEKDRLAKEAAARKAEAARQAEATRLAEEKRLQQIAAAKPPAVPAPAAPLPPVVEAEPAMAAPKPDASGRPTLLTPPSIDLPPPSASTLPPAPAPAAASDVTASAPSPTRSEVVPDETPAAASAGASQFVVQIGAYNSPEDAADAWKRVERSYSSALGGAAPEIRQTQINGKTKYRLRATGYADRSAANGACARLKSAGQPCFVAGR